MSIVSKLKVFWAQAQAVPKSCMVVLRETRAVLQIKNKPLAERNRFENELIRCNGESLKKFVAFFILQAPPGLGIVVIYFALKFPKYLLTHHFWNEEQLCVFRRDEFDTRLKYSKYFKMNGDSDINYMKCLQSGYNICRFASAHGIFHYEGINNKEMYSLLPKWFVRNRLLSKVQDIIIDDIYLWTEKNNQVVDVNGDTVIDVQQLESKSRKMLQRFNKLTLWDHPITNTAVDIHIVHNMVLNVQKLQWNELQLILLRRGILCMDTKNRKVLQDRLIQWLITVYLLHSSTIYGNVFIEKLGSDQIWHGYDYTRDDIMHPYVYIIATNTTTY